MIENIHVHTDSEYEAAISLFRQYAAWLNIDLSFQHFEEELVSLKEMYAAPFGGIILCKKESEYAGCIAIRKIDADTAELKRMYVKPEFQQHGIGNALLQDALKLAKKYNYKKIRLDTLSNMTPAINLYKRNGFYEIPAYYFNPESTAVFFEKIL
ncbi:MAG: GNAT family N-acetyltransferase [Ferruginibacter sp.]